jgi:uncharacterized protein YfbU (UPF0304 family)
MPRPLRKWDVGPEGKKWKRQHKRVYRHLDYFLRLALDKTTAETLTDDEVQQMILEETGFKIHRRTIRKYFKRLEEDVGETPLHLVEAYRINREYFEHNQANPPRIYHPRKLTSTFTTA